MIRLPALALLAAILLAAPAAADPRLVERLYDPAAVVRIDGKVNVQSTIRFAEDESIENVAIGDLQAWQVTPNRRANLLFVKPLAQRATTNMTVVTDRRTYLFDLVANPGTRSPLYVLSFSYPDEPEAEESEAAEALASSTVETTASPLERAAANDDLAVIDPASLNFAWEARGAAALLPAQVYDNGAVTFLAWAPGATLPAILIRDTTGAEGPVNFAVREDVIVIDGVPQEIILRAGQDMATLINQQQQGA